MGRGDDYPAARRQQPIELFHGADDVANMFDDMNGANFAERAITERERVVVEIGNHIGVGVRIAIKANGARVLINPASNIQD